MILLAWLPILRALTQAEDEPGEKPVLPQFYRPATHGPTLTEFTMRVSVRSKHNGSVGVVTFPAPSNYSGQELVSLEVNSDPPTALKGWKWSSRGDQLNSIITLEVKPSNKDIWVSYTAMVLLPPEPVLRTMVKVWKPWLSDTSHVPGIKRIAAKLANGTPGRESFAKKAVLWVAKNEIYGHNELPTSDSVDQQSIGGVSRRHAKLCTDIFRARGIPARMVAYMPTWANGGFSEEWLTEYWTEDGVWAMLEPTLGVIHPARNSVIVLAISTVEDEIRATQHGQIPGSPYLSAPVISGDLEPVEFYRAPSNEIHLLKTFPNRSEPLIMGAGYQRSLKVIESAKRGESRPLNRSHILKSLASDPSSFAAELDGNKPSKP